MNEPLADEIRSLYQRLDAPVTTFDCGEMCSPTNPNGVPFCCDPRYAIPALYRAEWEYLRCATDLWRPYDPAEFGVASLTEPEEPPEQMLLAVCQGAPRCVRRFRALSCRQFPFFPYITASGRFIGLAYEWTFEGLCWVTANLDQINPEFPGRFAAVFDALMSDWGPIFKAYYLHSSELRAWCVSRRRRIPIILRSGTQALVSPRSERIHRLTQKAQSKHGNVEV